MKELIKDIIRPVGGPIYRKYRLWRMTNRFHIVFIPSYECNYICPYCFVRDLKGKYKEIIYPKWVDFFNNRLSYCIIDISGGEPMLYKGIEELIISINRRHKISMTTNLSYDVNKYPLIWKRLSNLTISFHPHTVKPLDFADKIITLKKYRDKISVNIVAYPDQLNELPDYINLFQGLGVNVNIDPFISDIYSYNDEQIERVNYVRSLTNIKSVRKIGYDYSDKGIHKMCDAGIKHFLLLPNGDAYTCMCGFFDNPARHYIGNVFERNWEPSKEKIYCKASCSCGCDLDWVKWSVVK